MYAWCLAANGFAQLITQQPANQSPAPGANVTFSVAVSGVGPFRYQWQFNGSNVPCQNIITTIAGTGTCGYSGDGGPAVNARLSYPTGIHLDKSGNIVFSDGGANRVCAVWTNGLIQSIAGVGPSIGNGSYGGDGGPATSANLWMPSGLTIDKNGNVYFTEANNHRVRRVDHNGVITTFAGGGDQDPTGVLATNASLGRPCAIAIDASGNFFIAEAGGSIYVVDTDDIITVVAGAPHGFSGDGGPIGQAQFNSGYGAGLTFDAWGNMFVADSFNHRVRKVDTDGVVTTVAGNGAWGCAGDGGPATNATLSLPQDVAVDQSGNLFIADWGNRVWKVDTNGIISTVAGCGTNRQGSFSGDGGPATNACLSNPQGIALDGAGNLYISDTYNQRLRKVAFAGLPVLTLSNVSPHNAAQYRVIVTGASGSVTSAVATLTLSSPVFLSEVTRNPDRDILLNCLAALNSTNFLLTTTNLFSSVLACPFLINPGGHLSDPEGIAIIQPRVACPYAQPPGR
jgi:sugar lactone lactonase YvrE